VPRRDWPAFQPGSANGQAGDHAYPYTIQFNLSERPKGVYTLEVGMLVQTKRLSSLQLDLNNHRGWIYPRPTWDDAPGRNHWIDRASVRLPTPFLKQGINRLVLTAVDEPSQRDDISNSGIVYDALKLSQDPLRKFRPSEITVQTIPTIFYRSGNGRLDELVDVFLRQDRPARGGRVVLALEGQRFVQPLSSARDFGEQKLEFEVPEFPPGTLAIITVQSRGSSHRFQESLNPVKKWKLFAVPHIHLDVGFTDYQGKVAEIQSHVLDEAMDMIRSHPDFRFSADGYWVFRQFAAGRNASDRQRLLQLVKAKRIFVPAQYANLLTGFPTVETLIRSLYPSFEFDEKYGEAFDTPTLRTCLLTHGRMHLYWLPPESDTSWLAATRSVVRFSLWVTCRKDHRFGGKAPTERRF
jgi:alpha-mannosidase